MVISDDFDREIRQGWQDSGCEFMKKTKPSKIVKESFCISRGKILRKSAF
jgi:hypothetical protein